MNEKELSSSWGDSSLYSPIEPEYADGPNFQKQRHSEALRRSDLSVRQVETQIGFKSKSAIDQVPSMFDLGSAKSPNLTPSTKSKMSRPNSLRSILSEVP